MDIAKMSRAEVAKHLGVAGRTVLVYRNDGMPFITIDGKIYYDGNVCLQWLEERQSYKHIQICRMPRCR